MVSSLIVGGTGVSGSFIVSGLIERGHDVTVYTTGRTVPTEEESPWWYDGSITRLEGGVDSAEDVDATLTEAYGAEWSFDHVFVRSICSTPDPGPVHLPVHLLGRSFAHALVKTVKLWERPTPYELQKQLEVVLEKLPDIYRSGTTLNIWLEREAMNAQPPPPPQ